MDNEKIIHENVSDSNVQDRARARARARAKARARRRRLTAAVCGIVVIIVAGVLIGVFSRKNSDNPEIKSGSVDMYARERQAEESSVDESNGTDSDTVQSEEPLISYDNINLTGTEVFGENIYIEDTDVSGLSYDEAKEVIKKGLNDRLSNEVVIKISRDEHRFTFSGLGVAFEEQKLDDVLKTAILYGNHGSLLTEYKEKATLNAEGKDFILNFTVDENKINQTVTELSNSYTEQLPENAQIHRVNGQFVITDEVRGVGVDVKNTVDSIIEKINGWKGGSIEISADVVETYPEITAEDLGEIKDLLGSCQTGFSDSLTGGRGANLKVGASKINDTLLMPGESFSVHDALAPFTVANGYYTATAYSNGGYVDSIGGGICQIATTLYDACLEAEIEVVKRSNHSMVVNYVDRAFDATVNDNGSKDLVIRNNYDTPVYIESYLSDMQVCIYIYGKETRDPNRVVEYYSVVLAEAEPSESEYVYTVVTPGHPQYSAENGHLEEELVGPDEILQVQGNYPYCKAQLYKKVTINGEVVENTCLHTDKYRSSPSKFLVGANYPYPGKPVESTEASTEDSTGSSETSVQEQPQTGTQPQTQPQTNEPPVDTTGSHNVTEPSGE